MCKKTMTKKVWEGYCRRDRKPMMARPTTFRDKRYESIDDITSDQESLAEYKSVFESNTEIIIKACSKSS